MGDITITITEKAVEELAYKAIGRFILDSLPDKQVLGRMVDRKLSSAIEAEIVKALSTACCSRERTISFMAEKRIQEIISERADAIISDATEKAVRSVSNRLSRKSAEILGAALLCADAKEGASC